MAFDLLTRKRTHRDWSCNIGSDLGSVVLPAKEKAQVFAKVDALRSDLRSSRDLVGAGLFTLAGAVTALAISILSKSAHA